MRRLAFTTAVGMLALLLSTACSSAAPTPAPSASTTPVIITPAATTQVTAPVGAPTLPAGAPTVSTGGGASPAATSAATSAPAGTSTPAGTVVGPVITPAGTTPSAACTDLAKFVADVTIPDNTVVRPGQTFTKTWRLQNTGTCTWGSGYELAFERGTAMTSTRTIAVPTTAPGATVDLSIPLTAPTTLGTFTGFWRLRTPNGTLFGNTVWVKIRDSKTLPESATATPTP